MADTMNMTMDSETIATPMKNMVWAVDEVVLQEDEWAAGV